MGSDPQVKYACEDSCDLEIARGLDCHDCGHSMNCVWCCSNDDEHGLAVNDEVRDERARLLRAKLG